MFLPNSHSYSIPTFTNNAYSHSVINVETASACYISPYSTVESAQEHVYDTVDDSTMRSAQEHVYAIADGFTVQRAQEHVYARDDSTVQSSMHILVAPHRAHCMQELMVPLYIPNSMCAGDDDSDGEYVINQSVYDDVQ